MNRNLAVLKILVKHAGELPEIIGAARALAVGPGWVADRAAPAEFLIGTLFPIFDEVDALLEGSQPMNVAALEAETASLKVAAVAAGLNWLELVNVIVPAIINLYEVLRSLRNKTPIPAAPVA